MDSDPDRILQYSNLDRKIWVDELNDFVPQRIFDAHAHLWNDAFATPATPHNNDWRDFNTGLTELRRISALLLPGRELHFLAFPTPINPVDFDRLNSWTAEELRADPQSYGAMLVTPEMSGNYVSEYINRYDNMIALKPYYTFTSVSNPMITDYFPEKQMEVANSFGLAVVLHLPDGPKSALSELENLVAKYPRIRWILAHCAASGNPFQLERVIERLSDLPNIWYDTSGNNEFYTLMLLLKYENRQRIMFATDNALIMGGCRRGKNISYAYTTHFLYLKDATFRIYEQLRIMRQACRLLELSSSEIYDLFYHNTRKLLEQLPPVQKNMESGK